MTINKYVKLQHQYVTLMGCYKIISTLINHIIFIIYIKCQCLPCLKYFEFLLSLL